MSIEKSLGPQKQPDMNENQATQAGQEESQFIEIEQFHISEDNPEQKAEQSNGDETPLINKGLESNSSDEEDEPIVKRTPKQQQLLQSIKIVDIDRQPPNNTPVKIKLSIKGPFNTENGCLYEATPILRLSSIDLLEDDSCELTAEDIAWEDATVFTGNLNDYLTEREQETHWIFLRHSEETPDSLYILMERLEQANIKIVPYAKKQRTQYVKLLPSLDKTLKKEPLRHTFIPEAAESKIAPIPNLPSSHDGPDWMNLNFLYAAPQVGKSTLLTFMEASALASAYFANLDWGDERVAWVNFPFDNSYSALSYQYNYDLHYHNSKNPNRELSATFRIPDISSPEIQKALNSLLPPDTTLSKVETLTSLMAIWINDWLMDSVMPKHEISRVIVSVDSLQSFAAIAGINLYFATECGLLINAIKAAMTRLETAHLGNIRFAWLFVSQATKDEASMAAGIDLIAAAQSIMTLEIGRNESERTFYYQKYKDTPLPITKERPFVFKTEIISNPDFISAGKTFLNMEKWTTKKEFRIPKGKVKASPGSGGGVHGSYWGRWLDQNPKIAYISENDKRAEKMMERMRIVFQCMMYQDGDAKDTDYTSHSKILKRVNDKFPKDPISKATLSRMKTTIEKSNGFRQLRDEAGKRANWAVYKKK